MVTFAGVLAGRGVVVVAHPDGTRSTFEPVRPVVAPGTSVRSGATVAALLAGHPPTGVDPPGTLRLHWGLRRGDGYLDPLGRLRRTPPVLLPYWQLPVPPPASPRSREGTPFPAQPDDTRAVPVRPAVPAGEPGPFGAPVAVGLTGAAAALATVGALAGRTGGRRPRGRRARRGPPPRRGAG